MYIKLFAGDKFPLEYVKKEVVNRMGRYKNGS